MKLNSLMSEPTEKKKQIGKYVSSFFDNEELKKINFVTDRLPGCSTRSEFVHVAVMDAVEIMAEKVKNMPIKKKKEEGDMAIDEKAKKLSEK